MIDELVYNEPPIVHVGLVVSVSVLGELEKDKGCKAIAAGTTGRNSKWGKDTPLTILGSWYRIMKGYICPLYC